MNGINLKRLKTSLTKHGAAKLAPLLRKHSADEVLDFVSGKESGINIDLAQAKRNLSAAPDGQVPEVWNKVRGLGHRAIDGLTLIAIVFSHHELMAAMAKARKGSFVGRLAEGEVLKGKAYTNFAYTLEELRFSLSHTPDEVLFDLKQLFAIAGLGPLALELLLLKLYEAGWDGKTDPVEAMVANRCTDRPGIRCRAIQGTDQKARRLEELEARMPRGVSFVAM